MRRVIRNSVISISILGVLCYLVMNSIYAQEPVFVNEKSGKEYRTGLRLFMSGKHKQALTHFEKAYQLDERNVEAVFAQGLALTKLKKYKEASEKFEVVLKKNSRHAKALLSQSRVYIRLE